MYTEHIYICIIYIYIYIHIYIYICVPDRWESLCRVAVHGDLQGACVSDEESGTHLPLLHDETSERFKFRSKVVGPSGSGGGLEAFLELMKLSFAGWFQDTSRRLAADELTSLEAAVAVTISSDVATPMSRLVLLTRLLKLIRSLTLTRVDSRWLGSMKLSHASKALPCSNLRKQRESGHGLALEAESPSRVFEVQRRVAQNTPLWREWPQPQLTHHG